MATDLNLGAWCVVPAAGRSRRFGGAKPKQYAQIAGQPMLWHTLERLAGHPRILGLLVVLASDDREWPVPTQIHGKPVRTVSGGAERSDSVRAGLDALPAEVAAEDFVLVHDAARPCVAGPAITRLLDSASVGEGGLLAIPLHDTLKRVDAENRVLRTEYRAGLWLAQTPQMFRRGALSAVLALAQGDAEITDEASAMERYAGIHPRIVAGHSSNLKVTTATDLLVAAAILTEKGSQWVP